MPSERPRGDAGMVTAELAACLPVLMLVLGVALSAVSIGGARVRLHDAAREAVRAVARGEPADGVLEGSVAGARMRVHRSGNTVEVVLTAWVHPLGSMLPSVQLTERAVAVSERDPDPP